MQSKKEQLYALDIFIYNKIKFFSENKNGNGYCNMLNKTFAEETNRKPVSISRSISKLLKLGYIENIGNKQFRRLRITDKKFTYDKFVNNLDKFVNNLDKFVNNLDKGLIGLINNLDKPKLTILINLINNLDKQRIMNIIMNNNNEIINKEEQKEIKALEKLQQFKNPDLMFDKKIDEVFKLYKKKCPNLCPLVFEERNIERRQQVKDLLILCRYDMGYIEGLFNRANEQIIFFDEKINFQSLIKNHEKIYQGIGAKKPEKRETAETMQEKIAKWEADAKEREARENNDINW